MTLDQDSARTALAAIEQAEQRTSQAIVYGLSSTFLILWGVIIVVGNIANQVWPRQAGWIWPTLQACGFAAMLAIVLYQRRVLTPGQRRMCWRLISAQLALAGFAELAILLLGPFNGRQLNAFWTLVFMLGYVLAGIWVGRFFILCGIAIAVLTVVGFFHAGPWFPLWMAVTNGAALIAGGVWLRRQGAHP